MARSVNNSSRSTHTYILWGIGGASVLLNVGLLGYWYYLVNINQLPLLQVAQVRLCNEPGYSRWLTTSTARASNAAQFKKFMAASVCFTDYETGKPLDIDSLRPKADALPALPAHP
jgi:hypothetical protein